MRIVLFLLLLFSYLTSNSQIKTTKNLIASCCTESRGCNGSAYCSACKNCTGCRHCAKNGGTCGVCSTQYTNTYSSKNNNKEKIKLKQEKFNSNKNKQKNQQTTSFAKYKI